MENNEYWQRLSYLEDILTPLLKVRHTKFDAQAIIDLLALLFSLAKQNPTWQQKSSMYVGPHRTPFFDYYKERVGMQIWEAAASLAGGEWTEARYNGLNFRAWPKPPMPDELPRQREYIGSSEIVQGPQSPLRQAKRVKSEERSNDRKIWMHLFRDILLLVNKPGVEIYEYPPFATSVFRFERELFREHWWKATKLGITHVFFCEYLVRPLYFAAMYDVRVLVPRRVSGRQRARTLISDERLEILPLVDLCEYCLSPIKRSVGGRKIRSDTQFCPGNTCKNAYHRVRKAPKK
jgi:hypothetical protein